MISIRSPSAANSTVWSPTMSPARTVAKPMVSRSRAPVCPLATVYRHFGEVAAEGVGYHAAHAQGGPRGGVDLVAVVGFDDFHVHIVSQHPCGHVQQLEAQVDAGAEIGGLAHPNPRGSGVDLRLLFRGETGGTDHHRHAVLGAQRHIGERGLGNAEIDQHIDIAHHLGELTGHGDAILALPGQFAGIGAHQAAVGPFQGRGELQTLGGGHRLHQGAAHAAGGTGNSYAYCHGFISSKKFFTPSNQLVWRGDCALPPWPRLSWNSCSSSFCFLLRLTGVSTTARHNKSPTAATAHRLDPLAAQPEQLAGLGLRGNLELDPAIQRGHFQLAAQRRVHKGNGHLAVEVLAIALENRVLAHRDLHEQVPGRATFGPGLALARQADAIAGIHARRHFHRQRLALLHTALAVALAAGVGNGLASPPAGGAGLLHREQALLHAHLAQAAASTAGAGRTALAGARTVTLLTTGKGGHADFHGGTAHRVLQGHVQCVAQVGTALGATPAPAAAEDVAEHVAKNIAEATAAKTAGAAAHAGVDPRRDRTGRRPPAFRDPSAHRRPRWPP